MSTFAPAASQLSGTGVPLGPLPHPTVMPDAIPLGSMLMWPANTGPDNWMVCNGSAISREEYKELFAIIGTTYGTGDGTHTFNLPNMTGRFPAQGSPGVTGGAATHAHTVDSHVHTGAAHTHNVAGSTASHFHTCDNHTHYCGNHTHDVVGVTGNSNDTGLSTQSGTGATRQQVAHNHNVAIVSAGMNGQPIQGSGYLTTQFTDWKADSFNVTSGGASAANTGATAPGTSSASSLPPYLALNFIIKVK